MKKRGLYGRPLLLFGLLALLAWGKPLLTGRALFYDILFKLFYPNQEYLRQTVLSGSWPLWNPHIYSGVAFAANLQSAVFYPLTYLSLLLDFPWTTLLNTWAHTALAGVFMFAFARGIGLSATAACAGGIVFALNGNFLLRYAFPSNFHASVWLPLILLAGFKKDLPLRRAWLLGSAALALQFFAGHPQYTLYSLLACGLCAALGPDRKRWLFVLAGAGCAFLALCAVQLVPAVALSLSSVRAAGFGYDWAMAYSLQPRELLLMLAAPQWNGYFVPKSGDPHVVGLYFGPLAAVCAALALRAPRRLWLPFAAMTLLGFLLALGKYFPLYPWLYEHLPVFRAIRFPCQAVYLSCFGISVLAGLGLERLPAGWKRWLPALIAADLLAFGWKGTVTIDPAVYRDPPPLAGWLREHAPLSRVLLTPRTRNNLSMTGRSETEAWLKFKNMLFPNFPMAYGVYAADGQEELRPARYEKIMEEIDRDPLSPWIDVFGVKYVVSLWSLPPKFRLVAEGPPKVFLNPAAFPKAYLAHASVHVPDESAASYVKSRGSASLLKSVLVPEPGAALQQRCPSAGSAKVTRYASQSVQVSVESPCPAWLVLTDAYDAGWRVRVNEKEAPLHRVNFMQRGVRVPQGGSTVDFSYPLNATALAISITAWLIILVGSLSGEISLSTAASKAE